MSPERDRAFSGEFAIPDEESTGPHRMTCPAHEGQRIAVVLLKERLDHCKEDILHLTASAKDVLKAVDELRIATAKDRVRLTMLLSVAATIGGGVASLVFKMIGG